MTNVEVIKTLRNCSTIGNCELCLYKNHPMCHFQMMIDAADVLEADEQQITELQKQVNEFIKNETRSTVIKVMSRRITELEVQLPKESEWETTDNRWGCGKYRCPVCNSYENEKRKYCPNCGAKMKFNDKQETESKNIKSSLEYDYCGTPKRRYDIEAQLPKEGEWMTNIRWDYQQPSSTTINVASQSATKNVGTHFLCRSTGKLCQNATEYGYCKQTVCNSCDCMKQEDKR